MRSFLLVLLCQAGLLAQTPSIRSMGEFVHDWQQSKQFTIAVADAMPAEFYDFKPNPEEMSFGEQMIHILVSNVYRFHEITGEQEPFPIDFQKLPPATKESVMRLLPASFDYVTAVLPKITPRQLQHTWHIPSWNGRTDPNGRDMIMNMFVHTAHHRAQCEVYLRLKNIKPPVYTF